MVCVCEQTPLVASSCFIVLTMYKWLIVYYFSVGRGYKRGVKFASRKPMVEIDRASATTHLDKGKKRATLLLSCIIYERSIEMF